MRSGNALTLALCLLFASSAPVALAQSRGIFVTPIAGQPFTAMVEMQRDIVGRDGAVVQMKTDSLIARDSHGEIYNEFRLPFATGSTRMPSAASVHIYDPRTRISTVINPADKTARQGTVDRPSPDVPPEIYAVQDSGLPSQFDTKEDLGTQTMDGVSVHGVRHTQIIPASAATGGSAFKVTDEYWYSDELRLTLVMKHEDPRVGYGSKTFRITHLTRTEPPASFFQIPAGYKVQGGALDGEP